MRMLSICAGLALSAVSLSAHAYPVRLRGDAQPQAIGSGQPGAAGTDQLLIVINPSFASAHAAEVTGLLSHLAQAGWRTTSLTLPAEINEQRSRIEELVRRTTELNLPSSSRRGILLIGALDISTSTDNGLTLDAARLVDQLTTFSSDSSLSNNLYLARIAESSAVDANQKPGGVPCSSLLGTCQVAGVDAGLSRITSGTFLYAGAVREFQVPLSLVAMHGDTANIDTNSSRGRESPQAVRAYEERTRDGLLLAALAPRSSARDNVRRAGPRIAQPAPSERTTPSAVVEVVHIPGSSPTGRADPHLSAANQNNISEKNKSPVTSTTQLKPISTEQIDTGITREQLIIDPDPLKLLTSPPKIAWNIAGHVRITLGSDRSRVPSE